MTSIIYTFYVKTMRHRIFYRKTFISIYKILYSNFTPICLDSSNLLKNIGINIRIIFIIVLPDDVQKFNVYFRFS